MTGTPGTSGTSGTKALVACLIAFAVLSCNLLSVEGQSEWMHTYSLAQGGGLQIDNTNGQIDVVPSDGANVEVRALRIAHASSEAAAKAAAEKIEIKESVTTDYIRLQAGESRTSFFGNSTEVRFHVKAPRWARLQLNATNGEIELTNMTGDVLLRTTNGRIHAIGLEGTTGARTTNGEIELEFVKSPAKGIDCQTTNGEITVLIPKDTRGHLVAGITNGDISVEDLPLASSNKSRTHIEGDINGGGPTIKLGTTNGEIKIRGK